MISTSDVSGSYSPWCSCASSRELLENSTFSTWWTLLQQALHMAVRFLSFLGPARRCRGVEIMSTGTWSLCLDASVIRLHVCMCLARHVRTTTNPNKHKHKRNNNHNNHNNPRPPFLRYAVSYCRAVYRRAQDHPRGHPCATLVSRAAAGGTVGGSANNPVLS